MEETFLCRNRDYLAVLKKDWIKKLGEQQKAVKRIPYKNTC